MQSHHVLDRQPRLAAALVVIVLLVCPRSGAGQITSDGTLGTAVSNTGNAYTVNGGRSVGNNLFHSFGDFNVPTSGSATFNGAASTANVLSRVTGGLPSSIDGVISTRAGASPMPNANFFLINPAGVMFGPGASIDVGGTFHASSTDRILFEGGGEFSATPGAGDALLSSAPPQAFGFLGSTSPIATDGTMGTVVVDSGGDFTISGGTYKEANLFHSFLTFSLPGGNAFFEGLPATQNVISRVTGGSPSDIDGFVSTRLSMSPMLIANFFLINPAGVVFGPGAVLDVGGSVHISTADQLIFPDRVFSAAPQPNELNLLSSALPQAFGFLADDPRGIDVNGAVLFVDPHDGVAGRTLSLVGGDITVRDAALLLAPGGLVQVVSVDSPGRVNFASPDLGVSSFSRLGLVKIAGDSTVMASGSGFEGPGSGGSVVIRSGQLMVESGGWVLADTIDAGAPQVGVDIQAKDSVAVSGGGLIWTSSSGSDNASGISILTDNLTVTGGGAIKSLASGTGGSGGIEIQVGNATISAGGTINTGSRAGSTGNIAIAASGTVTLSGPGSEISSASLGSDVLAGNISVTAADIVLSDRAQIRSGGPLQQAGEKVTVTARNTLSISGLAGILTRTFSVTAGLVEISARQLVMDRGFITSSAFGARDAGLVIVNADTVSLLNGAQITSSSQLGTPGAAGSVTINAPGSVTISGVAPDLSVSAITFSGTSSSGVFSTAQGSGDAGQISLVTPQLTLSDRARVTVATTSTGDAGAILANVGAFSITGGARVDSSTTAAGAGGSITINGDLSISGAASGLFSTTSTGTGNAGAITVAGAALTLADGGKIAVTTSGSGNAGTIVANVGNFGISGGARVDSSTSAGGAGGAITVNGTLSVGGAGSGLFSTASGAGNAGAITVTAPSVTVAGGGRIDSSTSAGGAGGAIIVNGTLSIGGAGSGLFSTASSTGNAGAVNVTGPNVTVAGGGTIDSSTTGAGAGGAIDLNAASQVEIASGGVVKADSLGSGLTGNITITAGDQIAMNNGSISTRAVTSDGGNITLRAPKMIRFGNSQITTSVESGTGGGGNIFIDPQFVILQGSTITANAFGGPGGNITIIADNFVTDVLSFLQASSTLSNQGTIRIRSPENNLKEAIAQLPAELVDASRLMRAGCAARHTGATSSLAVAGRGGVPADADGYLPSFSTTGAPLVRAARQEERAPRFALAMASWDCLR